jgi:hypothetical protein
MIYIPSATVLIVIATYEHLLTGPLANILHESVRTLGPIYADITEMDQGVLGLYEPLDILIY